MGVDVKYKVSLYSKNLMVNKTNAYVGWRLWDGLKAVFAVGLKSEGPWDPLPKNLSVLLEILRVPMETEGHVYALL